MRIWFITTACSLLSWGALASAAERPAVDLMSDMDHGPFVSATLTDDPLSTSSIFVYKGIAVGSRPMR